MTTKTSRPSKETKKPKQDKKKAAPSSLPIAAASHTNPARAIVAGRRR